MPNPIKQAPVTTVTTVEAAVLTALSWLVAHGYIPEGLAKQAGPWVVLVVIVIAGVVKWWNVMPWAKGQSLTAQLEEGRLPDVDLLRIEAMVRDVVHGDPVGAVEAATGPAPVEPTMHAGETGSATVAFLLAVVLALIAIAVILASYTLIGVICVAGGVAAAIVGAYQHR